MKSPLLLLSVALVAALLNGAAVAAPKAAPKSAAKPAAAASSNNELQVYKRAFNALDAGRAEEAMNIAGHGRDPALNKVLLGYYMAQPGNTISFQEMADFIDAHPDWPGMKGILAIAEQKMPESTPAQDVISWYTLHPAVTTTGFGRAVDALEATGQSSTIPQLVRTRWINNDFSADDLMNFHARFARYLDIDVDWARLDRLLWKNDSTGARRMYAYVDDDMKAVADARLALANQNRSAEQFVDRVPGNWQNSPGLLYERLRWRVRNNMNDEAVDILRRAPSDLGKPEAWWEQRQIVIRRIILQRDFDTAYQLATQHGQTSPKTLADAEFLAGWLALRFLNDPNRALTHFQTLYDTASTPISRARGAYWLGRTYEVLGDKGNAEQAYETAAALNVTFYGQLASARLYADPVIHATPEPAIPNNVRQNFYSRDMIRAVQRLHAIGEDDRAHTFFHAAVENADQRSDFVLLTELAYQINRPDFAIEAAKAATQKNMLIGAGGFPLLGHALPHQPEPAFTLALIRQESMFNPKASSPAGAHGLMQLMPQTAKDVARHLGIKFKESQLQNTDYNLRLGITFAQNQLAIFDGSYVLALAAYNAGPGRVHQWMGQIGDPRNPDVDAIDWVELIPVYETRNYVQRILESLQVYRARLNNGQAPLLIIKDLKR